MLSLRRLVIIALIILLPASRVYGATESFATAFVKVKGSRLTVNGVPYHFVGANYWSGMNNGASGPLGNRQRVTRELDMLCLLGVTNLRILAGSEGPDTEPWRIVPALQRSPGVYDRDLLHGLDFLLSEMGRRGMKGVLVLNNFWPWSGGMAQYLSWSGGGPIPYPPPQPGGSWSVFEKYTAGFYSNQNAMDKADSFIRMIVTRRNEYTGVRNCDDPTIMSWELANEPRGNQNSGAFNRWIERTSALIKSLDSNHLVTTGCEGLTPSPSEAGLDLVRNHRFGSIDYATAHIWAQNWGWYDPRNPLETYDPAVKQMTAYMSEHIKLAGKLGKPIVFEEFGLARDEGSFDHLSTTSYRDRYYTEVFRLAHRAAATGAPVAGVNFWAWAGEGRPRQPGGIWRAGDQLLGDPPHELQGWYSVYDTDTNTQGIILKYARLMSGLR